MLPLFVYGTLRPGTAEFEAFLANATRSVRPATIRGRLWLHPDGTYPFLTPGDGLVQGELLEIDPAAYHTVIAQLDGYEDYLPDDEPGSLYLRRRIVAELPDGKQVACWTYFWSGVENGARLLPGGDWLQR